MAGHKNYCLTFDLFCTKFAFKLNKVFLYYIICIISQNVIYYLIGWLTKPGAAPRSPLGAYYMEGPIIK